MIFVLDAYNIMYQMGMVKNTDSQMENQDRFLKKVSALSLGKKDKLIVVFDGQKYSESSYGNHKIRVIYSSASNKKADGVIKNLSENYENQAMTVVSSDGEIRHYVRGGGHKVIHSREFIQRYLAADTSRSESEIVKDLEDLGEDYWMRMFKENSNKNQEKK